MSHFKLIFTFPSGAYMPHSSTLGTSVLQVPLTISVHSSPATVGTHTKRENLYYSAMYMEERKLHYSVLEVGTFAWCVLTNFTLPVTGYRFLVLVGF